MNDELITRTRALIAAKTAEVDVLTELLHHLTGDVVQEFDNIPEEPESTDREVPLHEYLQRKIDDKADDTLNRALGYLRYAVATINNVNPMMVDEGEEDEQPFIDEVTAFLRANRTSEVEGTIEHIDGHEIKGPLDGGTHPVLDEAAYRDNWKPGDGPHPHGKWFTLTHDDTPHMFELYYASGHPYGTYNTTRDGVISAWNDARDYGCDVDFRHQQEDLNGLLEVVTEHLCEGVVNRGCRVGSSQYQCRKILHNVPADGHTLCWDCRG